MSLVERVSVLVAIVLGLALAELGTSVHRLIRAGKRVRWDWMSPLLGFVILLETVQFWWLSNEWYQSAAGLRLIEFLPRLVLLLLIYLLAAAALPDEVPSDGISLRAFYIESSRQFWAIAAILTLWIMIFLVPFTMRNHAALIRTEVEDLVVLVLAVAALAFRNIRVQQVAVVGLAALAAWIYLASSRVFH